MECPLKHHYGQLSVVTSSFPGTLLFSSCRVRKTLGGEVGPGKSETVNYNNKVTVNKRQSTQVS